MPTAALIFAHYKLKLPTSYYCGNGKYVPTHSWTWSRVNSIALKVLESLGVGIQQEEVGQREHGHSSTPETSYLALCFPVNQDVNDSSGNLAFPTIMDWSLLKSCTRTLLWGVSVRDCVTAVRKWATRQAQWLPQHSPSWNSGSLMNLRGTILLFFP